MRNLTLLDSQKQKSYSYDSFIWLAFSPNSQLLICYDCKSKIVRCWDVKKKLQVYNLKTGSGHEECCIKWPNLALVKSGNIVFRNVWSRKITKKMAATDSTFNRALLVDDPNLILSYRDDDDDAYDSEVIVKQIQDKELVYKIKATFPIAVSSNLKYIASQTADWKVIIVKEFHL